MSKTSTKKMNIKVGNRIRSYDFHGIRDCYFEGVVTAIEGGLLNCTTTKIVHRGKERDIHPGESVFKTPKFGLGWLDNCSPKRIVKLRSKTNE